MSNILYNLQDKLYPSIKKYLKFNELEANEDTVRYAAEQYAAISYTILNNEQRKEVDEELQSHEYVPSIEGLKSYMRNSVEGFSDDFNPLRKIHTVTWTIEVDARTHEEAAREALTIMQDHESTATCFDVDDKAGNKWFIDLDKQIESSTYTREDMIQGILINIESLTEAEKNGLFTKILNMNYSQGNPEDLISAEELEHKVFRATFTYSPECFDGRFFKWDDGYSYDTVLHEVLHNNEHLTYLQFSAEGYEDNQEKFLNDMMEGVKKWIVCHHAKQSNKPGEAE